MKIWLTMQFVSVTLTLLSVGLCVKTAWNAPMHPVLRISMYTIQESTEFACQSAMNWTRRNAGLLKSALVMAYNTMYISCRLNK